MLMNQVEREQRMAQVVQHAKKKNDIKLLTKLLHVVNGEFAKFDFAAERLRGKFCLGQISVVEIDRDDPVRAASFHLDAVEAAIAADIQHRLTAQVRRNRMLKSLPLYAWIIAQKMIWRGLHTIEVEIVKPIAQFADTVRDPFAGVGLHFLKLGVHTTACEGAPFQPPKVTD